MGLKEKVLDLFFGDLIESKVKARLCAAVSAIDRDEEKWRKLTGEASRNLSSVKQDRMIEIAFYLWENNPLARWLIEMTKDFIVAEGLPYEAANEEVRALLNDFWYDPINRMDLYLEKHVRELLLYGELLLPVFVSEQTGRVRLGYIDPIKIDTVETDPENVKITIGVILRAEPGERAKKLKVIIPEDAENLISSKARSMREGYGDGECFFFAINNVTNSPRGRSELLAVADWLDHYEQFLYDCGDKWRLINSFIWDLLVTGGDEKTIREQINNLTRRAGSVFGHNENVTLQAVTPDFKSVDLAEGARLFRNHILGALAFPEHWYGGGGDVNRACYSEDTEVFTQRGWLRYQEIREDDLIAGYDPEKKALYLTPAGKIFLYDYQGEMISFKNKHVDILVTPDHRMFAKRERNNERRQEYEIVRADQIVSNKWWFLNSARFTGEEIKEIVIPAVPTGIGRAIYPELRIDADTALEFFGYWLAEGHARNHKMRYIVNLSQKKEEVVQKIRRCLRRIEGVNFKESLDKDGVYRWAVSDKGLCLWLGEKFGWKASEKHIPEEFKFLSERQTRILFNALMEGDGSFNRKDGRASGCFYTSSKRLADDFQWLALRLGYRAKIIDCRKSSRVLRVLLTEDSQESSIWKSALKRVNYAGKVFCFKTPTGLFLTRRNGKVTIQGNTAVEMGTPTFKAISAKQRYFKHILEMIFDYVIFQALKARYLKVPEEEAYDYSVIVPEISTKDVSRYGAAIQQITASLAQAQLQGWIDRDTARKVFAMAINYLGIEIDPEAVGARAEEERFKESAQDYFKMGRY